VRELPDDIWQKYLALLDHARERFSPPLRSDLEVKAQFKSPLGYELSPQILAALRKWMRQRGDLFLYCFSTEISERIPHRDFQISVSELSQETLREIPIQTERLYVGQSFDWGIHIAHDGSATAAGERLLLDLIGIA
jgi:hypothetical protein